MADNEKIALDLRNDLKEIYGFTDEELEGDAELLDWLSDKNQNIGNVELPTECVVQNLHSLRDAIRCAKAKYQARGK